MTGFTDHPQRAALANEVHARPFMTMAAPERLSHLAMLTGEGNAAVDHEALLRLCDRFGAARPAPGSNHFLVDFGPFRLKWERHTEFCTWTFLVHGAFAQPFDPPALAAVPADWLATIPGERLVALHLAFERDAGTGAEALGRHLAPDFLAGSEIAAGKAAVWTDFRIHGDGFGRILAHDRGLGISARQAGRMVQRLIEIETYRTMALLALPAARAAGPKVAAADRDLAAITATMAGLEGVENERRLLDRLTALAAEVERITADSDYRFSAAKAYDALVERRIAELREARVEGYQTIAEFMDRRLAPAMRTVAATAERLETLAQRLARASNLLRTRVDIAVEAQNRDLLESMNRRARMQLRLQQTVEGLSVVAISYYVVGLLGYALRGLEGAGLQLPHEVAIGLAVPVVVAAVWYGIGRIRRLVAREPERDR